MAEKLFKNTRKQTGEALAKKYTVVKGDTLNEIAKKNDTTVEALAKANKIENVDLIKEGQVLLIPSDKGLKAEEKKPEKKGFTKGK